MRLILYQPDIPQNTGTILRLAACLGLPVDIIEPCGFRLDDKRLRRAGLDYLAQALLVRHRSWEDFLTSPKGRIVLLTTQAREAYHNFAYRESDSLLLGRESGGVPSAVHEVVDARVAIPLRPGMRSLNVALAAAMVAGEALRQTGGFADLEKQDEVGP